MAIRFISKDHELKIMSAIKFRKIVDLTHLMCRDMVSWPTLPSLMYEHTAIAAKDLYTMTVITRMTTHTGTHIDVQAHFIPGGKTIEDYPIESFMGDGVVLDLSWKKPGEEISVEDLKRYEDDIREGDVVMLCTNWDKKDRYTNEYLFQWPHLGIDSAKYLVSKRIKAVGIDALSIGGWMDTVPGQGPVAKSSPVEVHRILLGADIIIIEELRGLDEVLHGKKTARAFFVFAPLKLSDAEGSPCRAFALIY